MSRTHDGQRPPTVTTDARWREGGTSAQVTTTLGYYSADPCAVRIAFRATGGRVIEWVFARALLADGLRGPSGLGDVRVTPGGRRRRRTVALSLTSPDGHADIELPRSKVRAFLRHTYAAVPVDAENVTSGLDAEFRRLLANGTGD